MPDAVPYINACTEPGDALVLTWRAPEYNFFARRRFSAGHVEFLAPNAFATERDQAQMIGWLERDRIPLVLVNESQRADFVRAYPRVDAWIRDRYEPVGEYVIYEQSRVTIARRKGFAARTTWGASRWPCGFDLSRS